MARGLGSVAVGLWLGCFAWITHASAQDAPEASAPPPRRLAEVLITASRIPGLPVDLSKFPGNATVITAADIARSGAVTTQEVLARAEGVMVADAQGFGLNSDSTVNLRGIVNSARTNALVLLDGVRMNRLTGDEIHWQSLPPEAIERTMLSLGLEPPWLRTLSAVTASARGASAFAA